MVLVIYTENKIIHVLEVSSKGTLKYKTGRMVSQGTLKDAEVFFGNKQFDISKIEDYKQQ